MDREEQFEKFLGINTTDEEVMLGNHSICSMQENEQNTKYSAYEASEYEGLVKIFDEVRLKPTDTIVDFGCGMGRVLFFCNQRFMCKVTGIEFDKEVYDKLTENADCYHVRFKDQERKFSLLHMRAEDYDIAPMDNVFYMFNPFSKEIIEQILEKIVKSQEKYYRTITLIMYYCTYDMMSAVRKYPFRLRKIVKLPAYILDPDEKAYIYEL